MFDFFQMAKDFYDKIVTKFDAKTEMTGTFNYCLNDPMVPFVIQAPIPEMGQLKFHVKDFGTEDRSTNCYITVANAINSFETHIQSVRGPVTCWPASRDLAVYPKAGKDFNAFYDRMALRFFYNVDPATGQMVYAVDSTDVVAHETGHGLLDCIRPDFWSVQALEIWAFHEAFGDINAIHYNLLYDVVIDKALQETGGDMRKSNVVSKLAEQLGHAIYDVMKGSGGFSPLSLRDAVNNFVYVDPKTLPQSTTDDQLAAEPHSFGRLFVGVWWDIFAGMYEAEVKAGANPKVAIKTANEMAYSYVVKAVINAPRTVQFYNALAKCMLVVDKMNGSKYGAMMATVFENRKILKPQIKMMTDANVSWSDVRLFVGDRDHVVKHDKTMIVNMKKDTTIKLAAHVDTHNAAMLSVGSYDLANLEVEVPADVYYEFDENGDLLDTISSTTEELIEAAHACVAHIANSQNVGPDATTAWEVRDDKLVRTLIQCRGCCHKKR